MFDNPIILNYVIPLCITLILIAVFVVVFTLRFKNADEKAKMFPVKLAFWVLIGCEVFKIFYLIKQNGSYAPSRFPYVFCSMVMFAYPLFCFKKNKFSNVAMAYSVIPSFIVMALFIAIQPGMKMSLIQGHSYLYHGLMTAVGIYLLTSKLYKFKFSDFFSLGLLLCGYVAFSTVLSLFIGADISYFGPKSSYLSILYKPFGYAVGNLILCFVIMLLCFVVYGIIHLASRKKKEVNA